MRMTNAIGLIDDGLILEAMDPLKDEGSNRRSRDSFGKKNAPWLKWGGIAACLALLVIAGAVILPVLFGKNNFRF